MYWAMGEPFPRIGRGARKEYKRYMRALAVIFAAVAVICMILAIAGMVTGARRPRGLRGPGDRGAASRSRWR